MIIFCSQLLPHVVDMTRFLSEYFKTCGLPELRVKVYSILKVLLMSMGVGMFRCLEVNVLTACVMYVFFEFFSVYVLNITGSGFN